MANHPEKYPITSNIPFLWNMSQFTLISCRSHISPESQSAPRLQACLFSSGPLFPHRALDKTRLHLYVLRALFPTDFIHPCQWMLFEKWSSRLQIKSQYLPSYIKIYGVRMKAIYCWTLLYCVTQLMRRKKSFQTSNLLVLKHQQHIHLFTHVLFSFNPMPSQLFGMPTCLPENTYYSPAACNIFIIILP